MFSHPLTVQVFHSLCDSVQHSTSLSFWEKFLLEDSVQQFTSSHKLSDQVHLLPIIIHLHRNFFFQIKYGVVAFLAPCIVCIYYISMMQMISADQLIVKWYAVVLTSLRVMMLGCWPYLSRISISSDGSVLVLSITYQNYDKWCTVLVTWRPHVSKTLLVNIHFVDDVQLRAFKSKHRFIYCLKQRF